MMPIYLLPTLVFFLADAKTTGTIGEMGASSAMLTPASGSCDWFGKINCDGGCPVDYIEVRRSSTSLLTNGTANHTDLSFEEACYSGTKAFCCK